MAVFSSAISRKMGVTSCPAFFSRGISLEIRFCSAFLVSVSTISARRWASSSKIRSTASSQFTSLARRPAFTASGASLIRLISNMIIHLMG